MYHLGAKGDDEKTGGADWALDPPPPGNSWHGPGGQREKHGQEKQGKRWHSKLIQAGGLVGPSTSPPPLCLPQSATPFATRKAEGGACPGEAGEEAGGVEDVEAPVDGAAVSLDVHRPVHPPRVPGN